METAIRRQLEQACERELVLAIAGLADKGDEPGLVHFACARAGRVMAHREERFGNIGRGATRIAAMEVGVEMMTEML